MFPFWKKKRVTFSPKVVVHFESEWTKKDYQRARIGPWMRLAADRHRFQKRIREFDSNFGYIFTDIHREYMYDLIQDFMLHVVNVDLNALNLND